MGNFTFRVFLGIIAMLVLFAVVAFAQWVFSAVTIQMIGGFLLFVAVAWVIGFVIDVIMELLF